jgi:hypothetical protein
MQNVLLGSKYIFVCLSAAISKRGFQYTDFREIWYWEFTTICLNLQICLKLDINIGSFI